jgi:hypothetical protein
MTGLQSEDDLSETAKIAYQAFIDMNHSKTAHFNCLETIENKYNSGGAPGTAEELELERLLGNHDKNVLAFKTAMAAVNDSDEKQALIQLMSD